MLVPSGVEPSALGIGLDASDLPPFSSLPVELLDADFCGPFLGDALSPVLDCLSSGELVPGCGGGLSSELVEFGSDFCSFLGLPGWFC